MEGACEELPSWYKSVRSQRVRKPSVRLFSEVTHDEQPAEEPVAKKPKQRRPRTVVQQGSKVQKASQQEELNPFELQRRANIERNRARMLELSLPSLAAEVGASCHAGANAEQPAARAAPKPRKPKAPQPVLPMRQSARQRGVTPSDVTNLTSKDAPARLEDCKAEYLTQEEWLVHEGIQVDSIKSDGTFKGWVNPVVCQRHGIQGDAAAAWEANGGGKFTFKLDKKAVPAALKAKGWSDARAFAHTQLLKNPNMYFYRHVEPTEAQAQGEWTQEEHNLFVQTAREHGVGDKWGLFSSYIPQRVGYQCSAYYREVIIPAGLVLDARFKMTSSGRAMFCG